MLPIDHGTTQMLTTDKDIAKLKLSRETREWLLSYADATMPEIWEQSSDGAEMVRFLEQLKLDPRLLVVLCCDIADMAMPLVFPEEPRPAECLLVLRKWAQGEATDAALGEALEQMRVVEEASDKVRARPVTRAQELAEERRGMARRAQLAFLKNPLATAEDLAWMKELQEEVARPETGTLMERINRRSLNSGTQLRCHQSIVTTVFRLLRDAAGGEPVRCLNTACGAAYTLVEATVQQMVDEMRKERSRLAAPESEEPVTQQAANRLADAKVAAKKREKDRAKTVVASFVKKYGKDEEQLADDPAIWEEMRAALEEAEARETQQAQNSTSTSLKAVIGGVLTTITITVEAAGLQVLNAEGVPVRNEPPPPPAFVSEEERERIRGIAMGEIADVVRKRVPWDVVDGAVWRSLQREGTAQDPPKGL